jgi:DNA-binding CsgD family transcriptional regulator
MAPMPLPRLHERVTADVVDAARTGTSVALCGLPGSGRTEVLRRVADLLGDDGYDTVVVRGSRALRDRPLEALAVSDLGTSRPARGASLLATYVTAVERKAASGRFVLLADDADDLDAESVGALVAAWGRTSFPVVATVRPALVAGDGAALAASVTPVDLVEVPPLAYEETTRLAEGVLGGPLAAETAGRLHAKSGGMPGLVAAITRTARLSGRLRLDDGIWRAHGELRVPALALTVERLVTGLDDEARHAAQVLAFAGPVTTTVARRLLPWQVLESLDEHGLLRTLRQGDRDHIVLYPPLVGEHLRHAGRTILRLRVTQEISQALSGEAAEGLSGPVVEASQVRAALEVSTSQGRESNTVHHRLLAEQFQRRRTVRGAEWDHDRTADTAVPYLETLLVQGGSGAGRVFTETPEVGAPTAIAMLRANQAVHLAVEVGDVAAAHRALARPLPDAVAHEPGLHDLLAALDDRLTLVVEGVEDVDVVDVDSAVGATDDVADGRSALLRPAAGIDVEPGSVAALAADVQGVVAVERLLARGHAKDALSLLERTPSTGLWERPRAAARGLAKVLAGRPGEALADADRQLDDALDDLDLDGVWVHGYTRSLALATLGRFTELRDHVGAVMSVGIIPLRQSHHAVGNLALGAYAALQQGATDGALLLARQARDITTTPGPWPLMSVGWIEPVVAARAAGDPEAEAAAYCAEAELLAARGYVAAAGLAGILALRTSATAGRAERIVSRLPPGQGDGIDDMIALATASTAAEPRAALALYHDALERGAVLVAARALGLAVRINRLAGDTEGADRLVADAAGRLPGEMVASLSHHVDLGALTPREGDVVRLVGAGLANQQVARRLGITVSTVENHLNRIYRKLDVDGRPALVAHLRDRPRR